MIDDENMISKVLRALLLVYVIRVFTIEELRCTASSNLTLEGLVGRLTTFELANCDNYTPAKIDTTFSAQLTIEDSNDRIENKRKKVMYDDSDYETDDEDTNELEAPLARRFQKGKGKYKGKFPIIFVN